MDRPRLLPAFRQNIDLAERDAVRIAVMNLIGPAMQDPKVQRLSIGNPTK